MDDTQFGILISVVTAGLGGLVGVIKWSVGVLTKSLDGNTQAHLQSVKAMTEMSTKLDFVYKATGKVEDFIKEEISSTHDNPNDPQPRVKRFKTNPGVDR